MKTHLPRTPLYILLLTLTVCASVFAQTLVFQSRVVDVSDGDTVIVLTQSNTEFQVRCSGINAPKGKEDFAAHSRQRLTDWLRDEPVTVRVSKRDPDGTLVGTILWNGRDVCLDQVRAGLAQYDDQSEQSRSAQQQYAAAESGARNNRFGLWSAAAVQTDTSSPESIAASPETSTSAPRTFLYERKLTSSRSDAKVLASSSSTNVNVRGYFRKDGTYVAAHKRTVPDANFDNNWSSQGNVNPYTGEVGSKKQSRWITALKWIGVGATVGALMYLDAKYPTATARCNDGSYSYSRQRQGTCSYRGGVAYWLR
jgi:endonuclease YncB( thermonuclease family)